MRLLGAFFFLDIVVKHALDPVPLIGVLALDMFSGGIDNFFFRFAFGDEIAIYTQIPVAYCFHGFNINNNGYQL